MIQFFLILFIQISHKYFLFSKVVKESEILKFSFSNLDSENADDGSLFCELFYWKNLLDFSLSQQSWNN